MIVRLLFVILFLSVLLLYTESFGFFVQIVCYTVAGAVVNAGSGAVRHVIVFVLFIVYIVAVYWAAVGTYVRFSRAVFDGMKRHLSFDLLAAAALRRDHRRNTAFKYFGADERRSIRADQTVSAALLEAEQQPISFRSSNQRDVRSAGAAGSDAASTGTTDDSIEYHTNRLHWKINSLALFVDHDDAARMPRELFRALCRLDVPGSPGSGFRVVLTAIGRLVGSATFLVLLVLIVRLSADALDVSTVTQVLVTLICGLAPLIVYYLIVRCRSHGHLDDYSFAGKIERTIYGYTRAWPVHDLSFRRFTDVPAGGELVTDAQREDDVDGGLATVANRAATWSRGSAGCFYDQPSSSLVPGMTSADATELKSLLGNGNQLPPPPSAALMTSGGDIIDPTQVDLLITIRDEPDEEDEQSTAAGVTSAGGGTTGNLIRSSEPASFGSGASVFERTSPVGDDIVPSSGTAACGSSNVANQPTNANRGSRNAAAAADGRGGRQAPLQLAEVAPSTAAQYRKDSDHVGFLLRKQPSASTLPVRNQIKPEAGSIRDSGGLAATGDRSSVVVVDLMTDGDVSATSVKYPPEVGFSSSTAAARNAGSTRSLPSYKEVAASTVGDDGQTESAL
jgi:hypothetical protein